MMYTWFKKKLRFAKINHYSTIKSLAGNSFIKLTFYGPTILPFINDFPAGKSPDLKLADIC